jgi:hypothetical protein
MRAKPAKLAVMVSGAAAAFPGKTPLPLPLSRREKREKTGARATVRHGVRQFVRHEMAL